MRYDNYNTLIDDLIKKVYNDVESCVNNGKYTYTQLCKKYKIDFISMHGLTQDAQLHIIDFWETNKIKLEKSYWHSHWRNNSNPPVIYKDYGEGREKDYIAGNLQSYDGNVDIKLYIKEDDKYIFDVSTYPDRNYKHFNTGDRDCTFVFTNGDWTLEDILKNCFAGEIQSQVAEKLVDKYIENKINEITFTV